MKQVCDYHLEPVWDSLMFLYRTFREICIRHGLRFYADGGTMLGAVRHNGFIPWDDDMDLIMPRKDYDMFSDIAKKELPASIYLSCGDNKYDLFPYFMKLVDERAGVVEEIRAKTGMAQPRPPNIDIFPLDATTSGKFSFQVWHLRWRLWHFCEIYRFPEIKNGKRQLQVRLARVFGPLVSLFYPATKTHAEMLDILSDMERKRAGENSEYVANLSMQTPTNHWKREWFREAVEFAFHGDTIPVPIGYDLYLKCQYGDYMKLPPEEMRHPRHQFER